MIKHLLISLLLCPSLFALNKAEIQLTKVTDLDILETYDTHLVHMNRVWEGRVRTEKVPTAKIEVFTLDGKLEKSFDLNYNPTHIFPNGNTSVVVTGMINGENFRTPYTKIWVSNGKYQSETFDFDGENHVEHFAGDGKRMIFALFADRALLGNLKGPWTLVNTEEVIGPHHLILLKDTLYVLNNHNVAGAGAETISKVDLQSGKVKIVSGSKYLQGVRNLHFHERAGLIAVPEFLISKVRLFDPASDSFVGEISVEDARGMATYGNCLAVASDDKRIVSFFNLKREGYPQVASWDLSTVGTTFRRARSIGIDEASGKLFARSTYLCTGCAETMSSVIMAEEKNNATRKACFDKPSQQQK